MKRWRSLLCVVLTSFGFLNPCFGADITPPQSAELASPDGRTTVRIALDRDGRATYSVSRSGKAVIDPSNLGFIFTDAPKFDRSLAISVLHRSSFNDVWEQPWGEDRFVRNQYNQLNIRLDEKDGARRSMDVIFRAFNDGVAFRYSFPDSEAWSKVRISEELTEFNFSQPGVAWWLPAFEPSREEYLYQRTPIQEVPAVQTPFTVRANNGIHIAVHEAALVGYSGMNIGRIERQRFRALLTPGSGGFAKVERSAPFVTPWRTLQIADSASALAMSRMTLNLNEPNVLGDVSWVRPMKYVGIWWEMHMGRSTWAPGPKHGATMENTMRHIDFAAKHGFGGVLVEGWNKGWEVEWWNAGVDKISFTEPFPDFDLQRLTQYARSRGVQLIGHHETLANTVDYERQLGPAMDLYAQFGIGSVKTGYVADAGQARVVGPDGRAHFGWHEGQDMAAHHLRVAVEAAKRKISVNAHEPIKDTGLRRTYPNLMTREGARGMEFNAWGNPGNPPEHEANLVFTRLLAGPMDFTPGIFGMKTAAPDGVATTWAKQLALYVVIYSPLQMAADLLENYEKNPKPFQYIKDVPVDWSETRVLNGEVGRYVTLARKDRNSENWYLGSISNANARTLQVKMDFLTPGATYRAEIYRDGAKAHWKGNREDIVISQRSVRSTDTLRLRLAPGGGQAIRLVPVPYGQ